MSGVGNPIVQVDHGKWLTNETQKNGYKGILLFNLKEQLPINLQNVSEVNRERSLQWRLLGSHALALAAMACFVYSQFQCPFNHQFN